MYIEFILVSGTAVWLLVYPLKCILHFKKPILKNQYTISV